MVIGSGTPIADPTRGGPATAIELDDDVLLFDAGAGALRGLAAAGIEPERVEHVFLTHLHSDHTLGLDELMLGAWTVGRARALHVHGPPGVEEMVAHLAAAFAEDRAIRGDGLEGADPAGAIVRAHVLSPGAVVAAGGASVRAFPVAHGSWAHAYGYRIDGPDRRVVISGDTAPSEAVVEACSGCDVLVHEVYAAAGWRTRPEGFRAYHAAFHTSGVELGRLAARARPARLVLTHLLLFGATPEALVVEVRGGFSGEVILAEDGGR
ncbi:MAG: MBL fold metallo-hydrolase, partial [Sandaracinaceae bacterium]|nr:MBL fold metallo-hydrolase [Sandaracinaceae bacterium]